VKNKISNINLLLTSYFWVVPMVLKLILTAVSILVTVSSQVALASVSASYLYAPQASSDPGSEVQRRDASLAITQPFFQSENQKHTYSAGLTILDTEFDFDEPVLGTVDLLKVKVPVTGTEVLGEKTILTWSLVPGLHGSKDDFSKSKLRIEGQALGLYLQNSLKYALGVAVGDSFGKVTAFPLAGLIWQANKQTEITALFPTFKYEYTTESEAKYNFNVMPDGAQWNWESRAVGNEQPVNVTISGWKFTVGANYKVGSDARLFVNSGIVVARKFGVYNEYNSSRKGTYDLKNAWVFEGGLTF
jgi:hypothetical protein